MEGNRVLDDTEAITDPTKRGIKPLAYYAARIADSKYGSITETSQESEGTKPT